MLVGYFHFFLIQITHDRPTYHQSHDLSGYLQFQGGGGGCLGFIKLVSGNFLLVSYYLMVFPSSEKCFFLEKGSVHDLKTNAHNTS